MPGIENFAPERTLTNSGFLGSPSFLPLCDSSLRQCLQYLVVNFPFGTAFLFSKEMLQTLVEIVIPGAPARRPCTFPVSSSALAAEDILHLSVAVGRSAYKAIHVVLHVSLLSLITKNSYDAATSCGVPEVTISEKSAMVENSVNN